MPKKIRTCAELIELAEDGYEIFPNVQERVFENGLYVLRGEFSDGTPWGFVIPKEKLSPSGKTAFQEIESGDTIAVRRGCASCHSETDIQFANLQFGYGHRDPDAARYNDRMSGVFMIHAAESHRYGRKE